MTWTWRRPLLTVDDDDCVHDIFYSVTFVFNNIKMSIRFIKNRFRWLFNRRVKLLALFIIFFFRFFDDQLRECMCKMWVYFSITTRQYCKIRFLFQVSIEDEEKMKESLQRMWIMCEFRFIPSFSLMNLNSREQNGFSFVNAKMRNVCLSWNCAILHKVKTN